MSRFDLATLVLERERLTKGFRRLWAVGAIVFGLLAAWIASEGALLIYRGSIDKTQELVISVLLAGLAFGAGLMIFAVWKTAPGVVSATIQNNGVRFGWSSGRTETLSWRELARGFVLLDYSANPVITARTKTRLWEVRRWNRPPSYLSREAFDALIAAASAHGLRVLGENLTNPSWGWARCRTVRFT